ncbi:serpin family protein [Paenibacillus sp. MMS20-IR301]|uniref:serpin family protein n=1 Tax=Paenibacillus sp. MMS20-IR301 TaxID=2895946 RepID=UPI0028E7259C|nr:serpin family protein [Paenibacillus sp. MMS20-IR301]WNS43639.1 serpin family protein [Paenibacillus sp. MMS20-IR301]
MSYSERQAAAAKLDFGLAEKSNRLGVQLLGELWEPGGGNLTVSPYSVAAALSLAYNGAAGGTAEELGEVLGYAPGERSALNSSQQALLQVLNHAGPGIELKIANSVWGMEGLPLRKEYLQVSEASYNAEIQTTDLAAAKSVTVINDWVADHTEHKIKEMLTEPPGPQAVAVLVNALYFKGGWTDVFPEAATAPASFYPPDGAAVQAMMMQRSGLFQYTANEKWQAVKLSYGEGQMEMVVILPDEKSSLQELAAQLASGGLSPDEGFAGTRGTLRLPRFTASYGTELKPALQQLGVKLAFDQDRGDFSQLADLDSPIYFSKVIHKTYIDVNERGTEAAASTVIEMRAGSAPPAEAPFEMTVNRPFLFMIRDVQTRLVLFLGVIENPVSTGS